LGTVGHPERYRAVAAINAHHSLQCARLGQRFRGEQEETRLAKIIEIEGIGEAFAAKLEGAGVATVEALLQKGGSPAGRKSLAEATGLSTDRILEWVNRADLMRIKGVGSEYSDLLEAGGVDTVKELATRRPDNLHAKLLEVNEAKKLVRRTPTLNEVEAWVAEAKTLPAAVTY
jgi:predicted flap endonuclease-1-like 5' DNA nuclease